VIGEQVPPALTQTSCIEEHLEKTRLLSRSEPSVSAECSDRQQCQNKYMLLIEKEMNERRLSETELVRNIEDCLSDISLEVLREGESRTRSLDLLSNSCACG